MSVKHSFQSGRADNVDAGAIQPSQWNADHSLTGMLAILDQLAPSPNTVFTLDGSNQLSLQATASFAPIYSPVFTGVPTAPTASQTVNSTQIATTEYVRTAITTLIGGAPGALDTLNELATAINDDASYAATVTAALGVRLRVDAAQGLTSGQKAQGLSNLGVNQMSSIASGADFNTVQTTGTYYTAANNCTNTPTAGQYWYLEVFLNNTNFILQRATLYDAAGALTYQRTMVSGSWGAWHQVIELDASGKLPAVDGSQLTNIVFAGAVQYDQAQTLTADQKAAAQANLGGFPFNGQIVESHAAGAVTFAVKTPSGADPSAATPVVFRFPTGGGAYTFVSVTAALSITIPSGATLGQTNGQAFRLWVGAFNDAGTVRLAVRTNSTGKLGYTRPPETRPQSSTLTPANAANVFYSTGAAVTSKYWSWIAHATYESGLATVGTWAVSPDYVALVDASSPRPGDVVQEVTALGPAGTVTVSDTAGPYDVISQAITPSSAANNMDIESDGFIYIRTAAASGNGNLLIANGSTAISPSYSQFYQNASTDALITVRPHAVDRPNTIAAVTYKLRALNIATGTGQIQYSGWSFRIREIYT